jgi:hypothetical protein
MHSRIDYSGFYVKDTIENMLHGPDGGPFPYSTKATARAAAANMNRRGKSRLASRGARYVVVTWITLTPAH